MKIKYLKTEDSINLRYAVSKTLKKSKGSIIIVQGRTEFIEKHFENIEDFNKRGFDVFTMDIRGQGLSSRLLSNRLKGYVHNFNDYINDLAYFFKQIVKKEGTTPFIIIGHSMGGLISMGFLNKHQSKIAKAILLSPMFGIKTFPPLPNRIAKSITKFQVKRGKGINYVIGTENYLEKKYRTFKGNPLTTSKKRFFETLNYLNKNEALKVGGATWNWLDQSFQYMENLKSFSETIVTPILICSSEKEKIVDNKKQKEISIKLSNGQLKIIPKARHEILQEKDEIRNLFFKLFEEFMGTN